MMYKLETCFNISNTPYTYHRIYLLKGAMMIDLCYS